MCTCTWQYPTISYCYYNSVIQKVPTQTVQGRKPSRTSRAYTQSAAKTRNRVHTHCTWNSTHTWCTQLFKSTLHWGRLEDISRQFCSAGWLYPLLRSSSCLLQIHSVGFLASPNFCPHSKSTSLPSPRGGRDFLWLPLSFLPPISPPISSTNIRNRVHIWWKRFKHKMVAFKQTKIDNESSQYRIIYLIISTEYCLIFKICTLSLVNSYDRWIACKTQWGKCTFVQIAHCALHHVVVLLWNAVQSTQLL